jgi:pimeloyl-ACP methyl ester carboxylesterase
VSFCGALYRRYAVGRRSKALRSLRSGRVMPVQVVLVPGGLYEDMDVDRFWVKPGVSSALEAAGHRVLAVNRLSEPRSWEEDAQAVADAMTEAAMSAAAVVAGSNGCSTAVRLALDHPGLVVRLVLCWPATAGAPDVDARQRRVIASRAGPEVTDRLLGGETLRGTTDDELRRLNIPVALIPSEPENPFHRWATVDALDSLFPNSKIAGRFPEAPRPEFLSAQAAFAKTVADLVR